MTRTEANSGTGGTFRFWVSEYEAVLGLTLVLVLVGTINVFSSSFVVAASNYGDPYFFLRKQGMNVGLGFVCLLIGLGVDYHMLAGGRIIGFVLVTCMLIAVFFVGIEVNGAQRWLAVGPMRLQPAELAKPVAIFLEACYIAKRVKNNNQCELLHPEIGLIVLMALMVEQEPDMGTALIIVGIPLTMLFCSNLEHSTRLKLLAAGAAAGVFMCIYQPYRLKRIWALLDPWGDAQGAGYQIVQSLQAIGSGGFWGMGMGMGISKYHYLPEAHTDFAFSVWCQEMGFCGAFFVFVMFAAFAYYGIRIANHAKDELGQMLAFGLTMLIVVQAIINLFMIAGCLPVVGVPLPFISYGGTSLFVSLFAVGVLANIGNRSMKKRKIAVSSTPSGPEDYERPRLRRVK